MPSEAIQSDRNNCNNNRFFNIMNVFLALAGEHEFEMDVCF